MAGQMTDGQPFNPYLSNAQQELLLAALASNTQNRNQKPSETDQSNSNDMQSLDFDDTSPFLDYLDGNTGFDFDASNLAGAPMFGTAPRSKLHLAASASNAQNQNQNQKPSEIDQSNSNDMQSLDFDDTSPFLDYLEGDTGFDFDASDLAGTPMFGTAPSSKSDSSDGGDKPDKRKSPEESTPEDELDPKRREGENKEGKKPGRKPLTSEPTTKRKAQNRAAQRAFRERKERHLKDLETKVESLTKTQEQDKQENGLLRAQVGRLQAELTEYRKKMAYSSAGIGGQSPPAPLRSGSRSNSNTQSDFQFDFPKFGALPGNQLFGNGSASGNQPAAAVAAVAAAQAIREKTVSPTAVSETFRHNSDARSTQSPGLQQLSTGQTSRSDSINQNPINNEYADLFSPSVLNGLNTNNQVLTTKKNNSAFAQPADNGTDSNSGISRVFRFNSGSNSTVSPSASSSSHFNNSSCNNSSCGTSPESTESPSSELKQPVGNDFNNTYSLNPINSKSTPTSNTNNSIPNFDWFATQNGGQFDPVLFGDYRESQDAVIGDGDFNSGFFDAAFPYDLASPLNIGDSSSPRPPQQPSSASRKLLAEVERQRDGNDDDGISPQMVVQQQSKQGNNVSLQQAERMLNCNTIWSQLQSNQDFKDGKFDLDNLCSELRAKAKCSESGVTVPSEYVDAAFKKLSGTEIKPLDEYQSSHAHKGIDYLFNQHSVDEAIRRLGQK